MMLRPIRSRQIGHDLKLRNPKYLTRSGESSDIAPIRGNRTILLPPITQVKPCRARDSIRFKINAIHSCKHTNVVQSIQTLTHRHDNESRIRDNDSRMRDN